MAEEKKLTRKQQAFCYEYVKDHNGAQAAIRAGYSQNTARQIATVMLSKDYIKAAVAEREAEKLRRNAMTVDKVLSRLADMATVSVNDLVEVATERVCVGKDPLTKEPIFEERQVQRIKLDENGQIPKGHVVKRISTNRSGQIQIETYDAQKSLELFMRHFGMFRDTADITVQHSGAVDVNGNLTGNITHQHTHSINVAALDPDDLEALERIARKQRDKAERDKADAEDSE